MVEVKGPSGGHLVQPPLYIQALVLLACQGFRAVIEAASHLSLFAPLCQPWCLPEPIQNSFSSVTRKATSRVEARMGSVSCARMLQTRSEQKNAAAGRSSWLAVEPQLCCVFPLRVAITDPEILYQDVCQQAHFVETPEEDKYCSSLLVQD